MWALCRKWRHSGLTLAQPRAKLLTMLGGPAADWRADRREAARERILETAWMLAREHGLAGLSLRDLARRLGMAAPSLYSYFASKDALYDAMYGQGYRDLIAKGPIEATDLREAMRLVAERFAQFCVEDPVRYQLLFQRTIPGFVPSEESYELAKQSYAQLAEPASRFGIHRQDDHDLIAAVFVGLVAQQLANEPTTTRWIDQIDRAVDMLFDHLQPDLRPQRGNSAARPRSGRAASAEPSRRKK